MKQQEITEEMLADVGPVVNRIIQIDRIAPHPQNYNTHPEAQLRDLMASDARFNQVRSIVVQQGAPDHYLMVAGHGYTQARKERGRTWIKADVIPADWTPDQVIGYLVADNLLQQKSLSNDDLLTELIKSQQEAGFDLASLGVDDDMLNDLLAKMAPPPSLDELAEEFGAEPVEEDFWPVLRLKVSPETKERLESLMADAGNGSDDTKLRKVLDAVDTAAMGYTEE